RQMVQTMHGGALTGEKHAARRYQPAVERDGGYRDRRSIGDARQQRIQRHGSGDTGGLHHGCPRAATTTGAAGGNCSPGRSSGGISSKRKAPAMTSANTGAAISPP